MLRTLFAYGFFDRAGYADDDSRIDRTGHAQEARRLAEAGTVLLKNDGALPLDSARLDSLAVIGADGDAYKNGGGSSNVVPYSLVTPRAGIATRAGSGVDVRYDPGDDPARAAEVARGADAAVVVVADTAGEGADKPCLALDCGAPAGLKRDELIERVAAANKRTIVVLETAGPVLTPWRGKVEGIVEAWYPGSDGGAAIARVLFGDVDPGGRLPATFPRRERDLPTAGNRRRYPGIGNVVHYSEGVLVGYRWYDQRGIEPAFPFGHGLSYTRFAFRKLRVRRHGGGAEVAIDVVNVGRRSGIAVPQLYLGLPGARGRVQPPRQLKGFESVSLRRGRSARVRFHLDSRAFSYWSSHRAPLAGRAGLLPRAGRPVLASDRRPRDDRNARRQLPGLTSTLPADMAYSVRPAASRASSRVAKPRWRITFPPRMVSTQAIGLSGSSAAAPAADGTAAEDDDVIADRPHVVGVRLHLLPDLVRLLEVVAHAGVADVAAALHARAGERQELDLRVVQLQQAVDVAATDRSEGLPSDRCVVLGHRCGVSRLDYRLRGGSGTQHEDARAALGGLDVERAVQQLGAFAHHGEAEVAGLRGPQRVRVAEAFAVVGHAQLEARVDRAQRERDGFRAGVAQGVDDRLLRDPEQHAGHVRGQLDGVDRDEHVDPVAPVPDRQAVLDCRLRRTAPRTRRARVRRARRAAPGCCARSPRAPRRAGGWRRRRVRRGPPCERMPSIMSSPISS